MAKAMCMDASGSLSLEQWKVYYVFAACPKSFYVSKFDNKKAHMGCYDANRFKVQDDPKRVQVEQLSLF